MTCQTYTVDGEELWVNAVEVDTMGTVWCGSYKGLHRFDGKSWKIYTMADGLADSFVTRIACGADGELWIGTENGLSRFDGKTWISYTANDVLPKKGITALAVGPDRCVWVGTSGDCGSGGGLSRFDGETWSTFTIRDGLLDMYVSSIAVTPDNEVWAGSYFTGGVTLKKGNEWTRFTTDAGFTRFNPVFDAAAAPDGSIWFGTYYGIFRYRDEKWTRYTIVDGLKLDSVYSLVVDSTGAVWAGTKGGIARFDNERWQWFNTGLGPGGESIDSIAIAPDGMVWCTTETGGISSFDGTRWKTYTTADGLMKNTPLAVLIGPNGVVWSRFPNGMSRFDGTSWKDFSIDDKLNYKKFDWFSTIIDHDGNFWFCTVEGISRYDLSEWRTFTTHDGITPGAWYVLSMGPDGAVWAELWQSGGFMTFRDGKWISYTPEGLPEGYFVGYLAFAPNGAQWFTLYRKSASYPNDAGVARFFHGEWTTCLFGEGLRGTRVLLKAFTTDGSLWIGTDAGLSRFDGKTWTSYTPESGLASGYVSAIVPAPGGEIWIGTGDGVSRLVPDNPAGITEIPKNRKISILCNNPNPFNASTLIEFELPLPGIVELVIYDITGRTVRDLSPGRLPAGRNAVWWDGRDNSGAPVASGIYISGLRCGKLAVSGRMTLVK